MISFIESIFEAIADSISGRDRKREKEIEKGCELARLRFLEEFNVDEEDIYTIISMYSRDIQKYKVWCNTDDSSEPISKEYDIKELEK